MPQRTSWQSQLRWRRLVSAPQLRIESVNRFPQGRRKSVTKMRPKPPPGKPLDACLLAFRGPKHAVSLKPLVTLVIRGLRITPLSPPARAVL